MNSRGQRNLQAMENRVEVQRDQRELKRTKSWPLNQENAVIDLAPPEENQEPNSAHYSKRVINSEYSTDAREQNNYCAGGKGRALFSTGVIVGNSDLHRNSASGSITISSNTAILGGASNSNSSVTSNVRGLISNGGSNGSSNGGSNIAGNNSIRPGMNTQNIIRNSASSSIIAPVSGNNSNAQAVNNSQSNNHRNSNSNASSSSNNHSNNASKAVVSSDRRPEIPSRFDGSLLSAATLSRPAGCGFTGHASGDNDRTLSSMCFKIFEGKVTSMAVTTDGLYCIAAFSKGSIRLFDLTAGGNTDPEDRYGSYLGSIDANTTMNLHLELGGNASCSHLFVGARAGSTKMFVVDMHSLRDIKRKRGFITMAGGNIKTFSHADGKLKGFCALSTVECTLKSIVGDEEQHCYSARYRLVCGKGCGTFNVWDVLLDATYDPVTKSTAYSGFWSLLHTGSVGSPIMKFAAFVTTSPSSIIPRPTNTSNSSVIDSISVNDNSRSLQQACEVLIVGDKEAKSHNLYACTPTAMDSDKAPVKTIKGLTDLFASSEDGRVIFSGRDELVVTTYMPLSGEHDEESGPHAGTVYKRMCLPLIDSNTSNTSKRNRQIREICGVSCNNNGTYALVHCTDNTVFLYSKCGYLCSKDNFKPTDGGLTLLFQAIDTYTLEMTINDLSDYDRANPSTTCECSHGADCGVHSHPTLVTLAFAWYLTTSGGGTNSSTLRTTRLSLNNNEQLLPSWLTVPGVGLVRMNSNQSKLCWLCGDNCIVHWDRDACHDETIEEVSPVVDGANDTGAGGVSEDSDDNDEAIGRKKKKPIEAHEARLATHHKRYKVDAKAKTGSGVDTSLMAERDAALEEELTYFRHQVSMLEDQLKASQQEINLVIRKADRRFDDEKRLRKQWNIEKRSLLDEHERLQQELQRCQDADKERNNLKSLVQESANSLINLLNGMY